MLPLSEFLLPFLARLSLVGLLMGEGWAPRSSPRVSIAANPCIDSSTYFLSLPRSLRIYFNHSECVMVRVYPSEVDEVSEITARLSLVTRGASTEEYTLRRNSLGQLGFHVHYEGIISEIEQHGYAWNVGLRDGARLVEICKVATCTLTHDQMIDLLRTSVTVKVVIIPPHEDGTPRR